MAEYTEYEKGQNYLRIKRHIDLLNGQAITEDLLQEYMQNLNTIRRIFPNMATVHPEIYNPVFRACAAKCEYHITNLLRKDRQFDRCAYMEFLHSLLYMADYSDESDDLVDMFDSMKFQ